MTFTWQSNPKLPNPYWFIPIIIVLVIFLLFVGLAKAETLGQVNNNPLNLKCYDNWLGSIGKDKYNHCIFENIEYGIRAGLKNLAYHIKKNPEETLLRYLSTFAKANSQQEAEYVAKKLNISIYTKLKNIDIVNFFIALSRFESKIFFTKSEVLTIKEKFNL